MDQATDPGEHSATGSRSARWRPDKARQREVALLASVESTRWNWLDRRARRSRRRSLCSASLRGLKRQIWVVITPFACSTRCTLMVSKPFMLWFGYDMYIFE